jgi:hypothetical protein
MTTDEALQFLREHQPMPDDHHITEEEGRTFIAILAHFEAHPDERCLPLLVGSVAPGTGLGMYQHIRFVFHRFPAEVVGPHLLHALRSPIPEVRYWGTDWALDIRWPGLRSDLQRIVSTPAESQVDRDAQEFAFDALTYLS